ncbi:MAG: hypothetical protein D6753_11485 [Planctomycetota bacterium]|nr:MAG: hypothetical protein D6753_11485 [Planctomycetota bacterium]
MAEQFRGEGVEVALPDQHDGWQNVVLDLGTTVHRYKSPVMATPQTRQTTWELQMMVPEGLIVTPPEPIQVDRKRPGGWTIRPADDQDTSAVVVVQVRALGTRGDKLQFQIFATAPQMSVLRLPMAAPFLEAARSRLHFLQQQLYVADRHWDQLAKSGGGVSREVVRQAQKQVDQQARQVAALLDFVADAARLEALLDGQSEVKLRRIEAGSTAPVGEQ